MMKYRGCDAVGELAMLAVSLLMTSVVRAGYAAIF